MIREQPLEARFSHTAAPIPGVLVGDCFIRASAVNWNIPLEAPVTMAILPSSTLLLLAPPILVDAVRVTPGRDMIALGELVSCDWMMEHVTVYF